MKPPTIIRDIRVVDLNVPLTGPFGISGGAEEIACNLLVTIRLSDGTCGYGEAAPFTAFNGETQAQARRAITKAARCLHGKDVRNWRGLAQLIRAKIGPVGSAQCALETAMLDALTRQAGLPLWVFFGGMNAVLKTDMTIPTGGIDDAVVAARAIKARGISTFKIKVGAGTTELDVRRVRAVHDALPSCALILDGNGGFTAANALRLIKQLDRSGIVPVLLEQPVAKNDLSGLRRLVRDAGVPIAADESVTCAQDVFTLAQAKAAHVVNIKLMKCGIVEALDIAAAARATGLGLMIGGLVETTLTMTTSACMAVGLGGFTFVDLDMPLFMARNPFSGGMQYRGARLDLAGVKSGHGVTPKPR